MDNRSLPLALCNSQQQFSLTTMAAVGPDSDLLCPYDERCVTLNCINIITSKYQQPANLAIAYTSDAFPCTHFAHLKTHLHIAHPDSGGHVYFGLGCEHARPPGDHQGEWEETSS